MVPMVGHWRQHVDGGERSPPSTARSGTRSLSPTPWRSSVSSSRRPRAMLVPGSSPTRRRPAVPARGGRDVEAFTDGTAQVQFKLIAGASDQLAGLVFNLRSTGEYLAVRYNTKDGNVPLEVRRRSPRPCRRRDRARAVATRRLAHLELQVPRSDRHRQGRAIEHRSSPVSGVGLGKPDSVRLQGAAIQSSSVDACKPFDPRG